MKKENLFCRRLVASVVCMVMLVAAICLRVNLHMSTPSSKRFHNLNRIGNALRHFGEDHNGALPDRLSQLVNHYIDLTNSYVFFWPERRDEVFGESALSGVCDDIDNRGAFVYLRTNSASIIAYERPYLWETNVNPSYVLVLNSNFNPKFWLFTNLWDEIKPVSR